MKVKVRVGFFRFIFYFFILVIFYAFLTGNSPFRVERGVEGRAIKVNESDVVDSGLLESNVDCLEYASSGQLVVLGCMLGLTDLAVAEHVAFVNTYGYTNNEIEGYKIALENCRESRCSEAIKIHIASVILNTTKDCEECVDIVLNGLLSPNIRIRYLTATRLTMFDSTDYVDELNEALTREPDASVSMALEETIRQLKEIEVNGAATHLNTCERLNTAID
ncbi:hypothetical protein EDC56_3254 [Sinobacterium caligoides]|uniref:HEAT repeat protein n=1 Tax=Sinobacterium caligoides TaxID=933926 RepID=A0A3N2DHZ5_9GAMM|nr:hypothetical protein [Sinobacterium caligoides]ROR99014.1 hypothetical protein EDC56_3254 [Sinobacterium caligoides]